MKKSIKTAYYCIITLAFFSFFSISCKEEAIDNPKFIDVNVKFTARIKPSVGQTLVSNLYYKDITGKNILGESPDLTNETVLTEEMINNGLRITFEDVDDKAELIYVFTYVDINENGVIDRGDLAMFFNEINFEDVEIFSVTPTNVAREYAINITLNKVVGEMSEVEDVDGNSYRTVVIGNQEWFAENLRTTKFANGDPINTSYINSDYINLMNRDDGTGTPAYSINPAADISTDGLLYNWFAVVDERGLCPDGWKTPSDEDWAILERALGIAESEIYTLAWRGADVTPTAPGNALKTSGRNFMGSDNYGFSALPSGKRNKDTGVYDAYNVDAYFWTTSVSPDNNLQALRRVLRNSFRTINRGVISKVDGESVRCVRITE